MTDIKQHVFEQAGLGLAPYAYLGCQELRGPIALGNGLTCGAPGQPMGSCQYCSTGIAYLFWLRSKDGKQFYVGSDCIFKSGDAGLRAIIDPIIRKHQQELRDNRATLLIDMFDKYLAQHPTYWQDDKRPHPSAYFARLGRTYGDYNERMYRMSGRASKAALARTWLMVANIPLPPSKFARPKRVKGTTPVEPIIRVIMGDYGQVRIIDMGD